MTLFHHRAEKRRKFCRSICTAVRKPRWKVYATYGRAIPKEWVPREMPQSLKNYGVKAHAAVHTQTAKVYFYPGGIDAGQGLTSTCGGLGTEQYGSWKPGVYFIPRKNVYITDARNQQSVR